MLKFHTQQMLALTCVTLIAAQLPLSAQDRGWENVLNLRSGTKVDVQLDGEKLSGKVDKADPETLWLNTRGSSVATLSRPKVKSIRNRGPLLIPGAVLLLGGVTLVSSNSFITSVRDVNALSRGSLPKQRSMTLDIGGLAVAGAGALLIAIGRGKKVYQRSNR